MTTLVLGASGATGQLVVKQLLQAEQSVIALIRPGKQLQVEPALAAHLTVVEGEIEHMNTRQLAQLMQDCQHAICCLGHNLSLKGLFGHPRKLVSNAMNKLEQAIMQQDRPTPFKLVLMSSTGVLNSQDLPLRRRTRAVIGLLRQLLPPHKDNELANAQLVKSNNPQLQWVCVRPDSLIDCSAASPYLLYETHQTDPIFSAGQTSRVNVARFMTQLICDPNLWATWTGKAPIIYNSPLHQNR